MRSDKGATLIEAAFIIPFVLLLVLGVADLGRAFFDAAKVQEAAQEGAIYASLNPGSPGDAVARAEETIQSPDFTGSITITCPSTDQVTVTVSYTFNLVTPIMSNLVGNSLDLTHSETARVLSSDTCVPSP
ncbi:MAG TPA: TadE family protein [Acidimicrobiia bacterium]|nr:TadE family protein [Acidimicrobiia bacterium]